MTWLGKTATAILGAAFTAALLGVPASAQEEKVVHVYNWVDYIGETTLEDFEKETGIKVVYDTYDASETVDAKLLAGKSGYDVVLHAGSFIPKLIDAGIFMALDKARLENWKNLDPKITKVVEDWDPGNKYGAPYMWGTVGVTYNSDMVEERIPDAPVTSLDMLFKPEYAAKLADCGISVLESPADIIPMALGYLGKNPNSEDPADYEAVVELFKPIRQYIKTFDSSNYLNALPNKELCMVFNWSGDYATALTRAEEAKVEINLEYHVPDTGAGTWFDMWLVPADAPHPDNAHQFINYLMRPDVIAKCTNFTYYANANKKASALVEKEILEDTAIYPDEALLARMWTAKSLSQKAQRARTRAWSKIKTGQ
jgi:putrescine transport system substrate-binding protein